MYYGLYNRKRININDIIMTYLTSINKILSNQKTFNSDEINNLLTLQMAIINMYMYTELYDTTYMSGILTMYLRNELCIIKIISGTQKFYKNRNIIYNLKTEKKLMKDLIDDIKSEYVSPENLEHRDINLDYFYNNLIPKIKKKRSNNNRNNNINSYNTNNNFSN